MADTADVEAPPAAAAQQAGDVIGAPTTSVPGMAAALHLPRHRAELCWRNIRVTVKARGRRGGRVAFRGSEG